LTACAASRQARRYCLVLGPTDMHQLHAELKAKGIKVEETIRPAWGAQGYS